MAIDHERLFKELISTFFLEFLDLFFPQIAREIDRDNIQFLPELVLTDVTAGEKKLIDLLVKVKYKQQETYFLIHIEAQSYSQEDFAKRMFIYFARLLEKYNLPIYPIVIFSFDQPKIPQPKIYRLTFPDLNVLRFEFAAIQLNRLNWRKYLKHQNPVAAALMSKMNIPVKQRPKVKAECLRLLTTLQLDPARMQLISGFVDVYLDLNGTEEKAFNAEISRMGLVTEEAYMEIVTSWQRQGRQEGLLQGVQVERQAAITKLLNLRFGKLDAALEAVIPNLVELSAEEYMDLIYQNSREELLSHFQQQS